MTGWAAGLLPLLVALAGPVGAAVPLLGQSGRLAWRVPVLEADRPLAEPRTATPIERDFVLRPGVVVADLGFYPSLTLEASEGSLLLRFSEGWCCVAERDTAFVGPVLTLSSLPPEQDLVVAIGETNMDVGPRDLLVDGNRIAVDLRGRDVSGGRLTLLVSPGSHLAERATMALIGVGLITLGLVRRRAG